MKNTVVLSCYFKKVGCMSISSFNKLIKALNVLKSGLINNSDLLIYLVAIY